MPQAAPTVSPRRPAQQRATGVSFQAFLQEAVRTNEPLRFSGHAQDRLRTAGVHLSQADLTRLHGAVERAAAKGAKESLILMDDLAFVVSVKNRTVITAVPQQRAKENVFTHIDSAVIT